MTGKCWDCNKKIDKDLFRCKKCLKKVEEGKIKYEDTTANARKHHFGSKSPILEK